MPTKDPYAAKETRLWRKVAFCSVLGWSLFAGGMAVQSSLGEEPLPDNTPAPLAVRETPSIQQTIDGIYASSLSAAQMQADVDHHLKFLLEPHQEEAEGTATTPSGEETHALLVAYLDGLLLQRNKYNQLISLTAGELDYIHLLSGADINESVIDIDNLNSPLISGLMTEMEQSPFFALSDEGYSVWIDYDQVVERYGSLLDEFHQDMIRLHKDIARFGYNREDGKLDAGILYDRLLLLDDIQSNDRTKDDFYWEKERYQLAVLFSGYGGEKRPEWDDVRMEQMRQVAQSAKNNSYAALAEKLVASIEKEGNYGEETVRIANEWMHENFSEYSAHLSMQEDK